MILITPRPSFHLSRSSELKVPAVLFADLNEPSKSLNGNLRMQRWKCVVLSVCVLFCFELLHCYTPPPTQVPRFILFSPSLRGSTLYTVLPLPLRFHAFLLFLGHPSYGVRDISVHRFSKIVSEFALEYRTTRDRVLQQRQKRADHRERNKTRGKMIIDVNAPVSFLRTPPPLTSHLCGVNIISLDCDRIVLLKGGLGEGFA